MIRWWRAARHRDSFERQMSDEMRFHLETRTDAFVREGMDPVDARRRARLEFGNPAAWKDNCRDARQLHLIDDLVADGRFTFRGFRRHPLLSLVVIATLTFGIGISTGVFTIFSATALRPPVASDPGSFLHVYTSSTTDRTRPGRFEDSSVEDYLAFSAGLRTIRSLAAYSSFSKRLGLDDADSRALYLVSCNFFEVYGPDRPLRGRLLQRADCETAAPVIVLSYTGWQTRFGGNETILGQAIQVAGAPLTIVGIAPPSEAALGMASAWLPYTLRGRLKLGPDPRPMAGGHAGHERWLRVTGRLAPGASRSQAAAELAVIAAQRDRGHPGRITATVVTDGAIVNEPNSRRTVLSVGGLVMGALSCLVLIACANVATLLLSRADARQREIAIRLSLGAGRGRVLRMLLTETLTLAVIAGAASVYVAYTVPRLMIAWLFGMVPEWSLAPDWRVFTYLAATVGLAGVAAGLAPALESMRADIMESLKGRRTIFGITRGSTFRGGLVVVQVALSFVLLVGSSLFLITHYHAITRQVGFETKQVLMPRASFRSESQPERSPSPAALTGVLQTVPGVRAIAFAGTAPVFLPARMDVVGEDARPHVTRANEVSPGFFEAIDLPIVRGRALDDRDGPCVQAICHVVVSEAFAKDVLHTADPLGRVVRTTAGAALEIVGVAKDTTVDQLDRPDPPLIYMPWMPDRRSYQPLVRFTGDADRFARDTASALRVAFPGAGVEVPSLRSPIEQWIDQIGRIEAMVVTLGGTALALAAIGVFGIVSFAVSRRQHELGVRAALGADRRTIYATVIGFALRPLLIGLVCGLALAIPAAVAFARVLIDLQFTVSPRDPVIYAGAGLTLATVIFGALLLPARRAARLDPMVALRTD